MEKKGLRIRASVIIFGSLGIIISIYGIMLICVLLIDYKSFFASLHYSTLIKSNWLDIRTYGGGAMILSILTLVFLGTPLLFFGESNNYNRMILPIGIKSNPIRYHKFKILNICVLIGTFVSIFIGILLIIFGPSLVKYIFE